MRVVRMTGPDKTTTDVMDKVLELTCEMKVTMQCLKGEIAPKEANTQLAAIRANVSPESPLDSSGPKNG